MKRLSNLIFTILIIFCFACESDPESTTHYTLINSSQHKISMNVFGEHQDTLVLYPKEKKEFSYLQMGISSKPLPMGFICCDTIFICYDDTICIIHQIDYQCVEEVEENRCLVNYDSYTGGRISDGYYRYEYEFTDEDYLRALER